MFNILGNTHKHRSRDLLDLESILQSRLNPVSPRQEFIHNLQKGLMDYTFPPPESTDIDLKKVVFFALVGLTGMVFVFSLWVRLIVVIASTVGMLQSSKQKKVANQ